ncbi:uncharacterized protein B0H18DRAFT_1021935 [Fomitopsis serialis]|uniref:uncharacterized protein n=1 Tax=Fomitopsis serialis TaxID=139415 RepID=UPI002008C60D|nr:uncharacterized protein B0H18DRAFT_1021935 [Neoantrodia serialis]KAH9921111.1 hypothetical protein B0H18DRAFT_1021935 [Neoantrodia serialis]
MSTPDLHSLADSFAAGEDFDGSLASTLTLPGSAPSMSATTLAAASRSQDARDFRSRASTSASREPSPPTAGPSSSQSLSPRTTIKPQDLFSSTTARLDDDLPLDIPLPQEPADLFIAPDGSYLETSSGSAAHDLKKTYDKYLRVGKDVRSPFAITAFINQHGKQMYRVGLRQLEAPGVLAAGAEHRNTSLLTSPSNSFQSSHPYPRKLSNGGPSNIPPALPTDGSRSPPVRKLRKTRSIPNAIGARTDASTGEDPPPTPTGRPHAHSVSSADAFRSSLSVSDASTKTLPRDIFADVMCWNNIPVSPMGSGSAWMSTRSLPQDHGATLNGESSVPDIIIQPFGPGVTFDSPSWRSSTQFIQPVLREMQSFESGLTARADPAPKTLQNGGSRVHLPTDGPPMPDSASAIHVDPSSSSSTSTPTHRRDSTILEETNMHSRYSTEVFDILQNSRGLPALDRLSSTSQETTIKLSLKAEESAAPRDDPRFVIWGEVEPEDSEEVSVSASQATDASASSGRSGISRRRSTKGKSISKPEEVLSPPVSPKEGPMKMLLAATIERWIAQITSELNYDELIVFLLTYRTYVSALDLGHLLICRFHWALGEPTSQRDEIARRVVRVRTFIAIRQWVVAFFDADFLPNRDLRLLYANWLNTLRRDPILDRYKDALKIVRQVRKVFRECADRYFRRGTRQAGRTSEYRHRVPDFGAQKDVPGGQLGADDPDLDLDFENSYSVAERGSANTSPKSKEPGPVDLLSLRQPLHLALFQYGRKSSVGPPAAGAPHPILMPLPHSPFSRAFVNTIGRLGRWKRVLNHRNHGRSAVNACLDVSAFDVEASETGDLLLVRGGVEQYLKMVESQMSEVGIISQGQQSVGTGTTASAGTSRNVSPASYRAPFHPPGLGFQRRSMDSEHRPSVASDPRSSSDSSTTADQLEVPSPSDASDTTPRYSSFSSAYTDTLDSPRTPQPPYGIPSFAARQLDIVSIDDLDLDDLSSDENFSQHVGMKKPSRRLPTRRDFEFVRHSTDSVSSMGIQARESVLSSTSYMSGASSTSASPEAEAENMGGPIQAWQMSALVDSLTDDGEDGDVEAALRRLEGQINEEKQRAKQSKVDRWVRSIQERQLGGTQLPPEPEPLSDSDDEDYGQVSQRRPVDYPRERDSPSRASTTRLSDGSSLGSPVPFAPPGLTPDEATTPSAEEAPELPAPEHIADGHSDTAKPHVEDAVPLEILWSRVDHSTPAQNATHSSINGSPPVPHPSATALPAPGSPTALMYPAHVKRHQSFVLGYRSETLMQHFCMIDRELFLALRFEELIAPSLAAHDPQANFNILDWSQFLRERARLKAEGRVGAQTGTLTVVRGRFNLIANFVLSEIVLTHPSERMRVYTKFIRLAWKAYELKNYNALVAFIAGLRSSWVSKAIAQCHDRLRAKDERILHDLTSWTSRQGHFMYIRQTVEALTEAKPLEQGQDMPQSDAQSARGRAMSDAKGGPVAAPACVPFFGVYLSQLERYTPLPDLIDPTAPHTPVSIDPLTNTFEAPSHPEVFSTLSPLPPSIQLEPLISVHKQRLVAGVVRSFVAAQHLASRVAYPLDKKIFQRCLKLRGLDAEVLERALALYAPQGAGAAQSQGGHGVRSSVAR